LEIWSGRFIADPGSGYFSIPDPVAKKATGSVTLLKLIRYVTSREHMLSVLTRSGMVSGTTSDKKIEGHKRGIKFYHFLYIRHYLQTEPGKTHEYLITWRILYELIVSTWLQAVLSSRSLLGKKNLGPENYYWNRNSLHKVTDCELGKFMFESDPVRAFCSAITYGTQFLG
jgi:hypothetical protein